MAPAPNPPPYYLRKISRVTGVLDDATDFYELEEARQAANGELSSGEFDEVEILDAAYNVVETIRRT